ncbi:MAG TPA: DUF5060 domain-containing protein [Terracidiphilus sp.]|nr:DUF5060 domain-containing protein [Terracidiphilus sp.]
MARNIFTRREFVQAGAGIAAVATAPTAIFGSVGDPANTQVHTWEKLELAFVSAQKFQNPYTDATVWVDLIGPGLNKRVYGFWDGDNNFKVRVTATAPGIWHWRSGSEPHDSGLTGKMGSFIAKEWTEEEKQENPLRRGFLEATPNHHALQTADGTPFFAIGDTWWATGTNRFKWYDDNVERPIGPTAGFKDYVRYRKAQGFNWINMIAAFPNWETDGLPWHIVIGGPDKTTVRSAWVEFGTGSAKNMDNEGGRPFFFPGKVPGYEKVFPDVDRINPEYFKYIDRKIDYLNSQGFVAFIEVSRRDASELWKKYYSWPDSYSRFIQYVWSRYQANNTVLSPIHLDVIQESITVPDFTKAIDLVKQKYGLPPFGTLLSANANPSTLVNWGEDSWVTLHQVGNKREHEYYWYMTEIFRDPHPQPALNGEPYYAGYADARDVGYKYGAPGGSPKDDQFVRSAMYGNFLSGGLAGHVYGAEGIWGADIEPSAPTKMCDAFQWNSAAQMKHLRTFAFSIGRRYQDLEPDPGFVVPSSTQIAKGYEGWAYAARTPDKNIFLAYFEKGCPRSLVRGTLPMTLYRARWFDPRLGAWSDVGDGVAKANNIGEIQLPDFPSDADWGLSLVYQGPAPMPSHF